MITNNLGLWVHLTPERIYLFLAAPVLAEPLTGDACPVASDGEARESTEAIPPEQAIRNQDSRGGRETLSSGVESRHASEMESPGNILRRESKGFRIDAGEAPSCSQELAARQSGSSAPPAQNPLSLPSQAIKTRYTAPYVRRMGILAALASA